MLDEAKTERKIFMLQNIEPKFKMNLQLLASDEGSEGTDTTEQTEGADAGVETNEKTFTQADIDKIVNERLAREKKKIEKVNEEKYQAQLKAELEESEKLAKMSESERIKAQAEKERKQFESERAKFESEMKAFNEERMLNTTMKTLAEKNLPVEFAQFLKVDNADDIMENISVFEKYFNESLEKMVNERLKGRSPITSTSTKQAFSVDQIKNMSPEEINKNWDKLKNMNL